jgi:uncharacterized protein (DUF1015 family)
MADIAPFRSILFDPLRVDFAKVLAPPYDVIDPVERAKLAAGDPHNVVRLILPEVEAKAQATDDKPAETPAPAGDRYAAAANTLDAWLNSGVLRRDDRKAIYRYHQIFTHADLGNREITRTGFIAAVKLRPFADGVILPHERTMRGPKEDRLALMKATSAHFSQIFTMYRDPSGDIEQVFRRTEQDKPVFDVRLPDGVRHVLWRCADAESIGKIRHLIAPCKLYIADGHHRYETMLALREYLAGGGEPSQYSAVNYGTMFLTDMDQQGLVILPTHRILHSVQGLTAATLLDKVKEFFIVDKIEDGAKNPQKIRHACAEPPQHQPAFAVAFPGDAHAWRLTLKPQVNTSALGLATPSIAKLDVTLLHGLVLDRITGITPEAQEAQTNLRYVKDTGKALDELTKPDTQAVFILGAARVDTVKRVADAGEVMPQKSTYFFPKLASGVVMNRIDPGEDLR